jgi:chromosome partitioning protein
MQIADNEELECQRLIDAVNALDRNVDFIVIDTPGTDSYLSRLAHSTADTLITPMNDSLLDFDVLGSVDPITYAVTGVAQYAAMVRQVRRRRRQLDGSNIDWVVMRNRSSGLSSRSTHVLSGCLRQLSLELGFRPIDGFVERSNLPRIFPSGSVRPRRYRPNGAQDAPEPRPDRGTRGSENAVEPIEAAAKRASSPPGRRSR